MEQSRADILCKSGLVSRCNSKSAAPLRRLDLPGSADGFIGWSDSGELTAVSMLAQDPPMPRLVVDR